MDSYTKYTQQDGMIITWVCGFCGYTNKDITTYSTDYDYKTILDISTLEEYKKE